MAISSCYKIGFVASTFAPIPGGMDAYLDHLSAALSEQGHDVHVATRFVTDRPSPTVALIRSVETPRAYSRDGVSVHVVAPSSLRRPLLAPVYHLSHSPSTQSLAIELFVAGTYRALATALDGCDIVHYSGVGREMLGFTAARVAKNFGVPFVVTPHLHAGTWGDGTFDFRLYQQAHAVIALTEYERTVYVEAGLPRNQVYVQGHGVNVSGTGDGDALRARLGVGNAPIVLYLGRKSPEKGFPLLLDAAPSIWAHHPDTRLLLAGPPDSRFLPGAEAARVLDDPRTISLGFVSDEMREDLYAACDVFCLPSAAEAFGLVYLEAGLYRKPVVALNLPTLRELIGGSGGGLLVESSPNAVAETVTRLLDAPSLRTRLGQRGWERARDQTWAHVATSMTRLYETLLDERSPAKEQPNGPCAPDDLSVSAAR